MFEEVGATATQPGAWSLGPSASRFGTNIYGQASTTDIAPSSVSDTIILSDSAGVYICPTC
jgi:hypothetical protein